jgi:hypothetical protein
MLAKKIILSFTGVYFVLCIEDVFSAEPCHKKRKHTNGAEYSERGKSKRVKVIAGRKTPRFNETFAQRVPLSAVSHESSKHKMRNAT